VGDADEEFDSPPTRDGVEAPEAAARDRAFLIVVAGGTLGETFLIQPELTVIGRGSDAHVRIVDDGVSRRHAQVDARGAAITLRDLGSRNGTFLNGVAVKEQVLAEGDKIQLGESTVLRFTYQDRFDESFQKAMFENALRDDLTKAFNKRYFADRLASEVAYATRHRSPLTLAMLDIDHFKRVNDTHGHLAGDFVLCTLAQTISGTIRLEDVFARWGGEEFAILSRGTSLDGAKQFAERMRRQVGEQPYFYCGHEIPVTISVGVAALDAGDAVDLVERADRALYRAKSAGRNRVGVDGE
jgi:diguanylate cyclase (GGDEF)-like protein